MRQHSTLATSGSTPRTAGMRELDSPHAYRVCIPGMRHELLALLAAGPAHGYELKGGVEHARGRVSQPLNIGQIYTTLGRLERDRLVQAQDVDDDGRAKRVYRLTEAGRKALQSWRRGPGP